MVDLRGILKEPVSHTNDSYTFLEGHANTALGDSIAIYILITGTIVGCISKL
ncbi:MAG: hypothetical protein F6J90_06725 [Moorea sp. SIOASIH]|uniref:hypothetical protein n=1 Tax=Moorena sp. SIOASIH TaxID=2607817 RepID=UPI0013B69C8A|nr:hypothetical protein [Moorena sp. SIOASIH]NEO36032.1 hypothetical protein [Moorena sp. SIOASIH]NEO92873.1 hypothetical protein [Moorena sp. SIO3G5]